jgi:hypothetical protein
MVVMAVTLVVTEVAAAVAAVVLTPEATAAVTLRCPTDGPHHRVPYGTS